MNNTVTRAQIDDLLARSEIVVVTQFEKVTVVTCKLPNGFVLVEASGAVSKENYSEEMGRKVCLDRIATKLWQFEGYLLSTQLKQAEAVHGLASELKPIPSRELELIDLLTSAHAIAARKGEDTAWERFAARLAEAGIGSITPRTFRVLPDEVELVRASSSDLVAVAAAQVITLPSKADEPLPGEIVWMPKGEHQISAHAADGKTWQGKVVCDETGARAVQAALAAVLAQGRRVYLDKNHDDGEATAWVTAFRWDAALGIVAKVEWTSLGEQLLRGKVYYSFSPAFLVNKSTGRVSGFPHGHAAGGLVNAPAFGAAMPALIAARLAGAESTATPAPGGTPGNQNPNTNMNRELLIKILAKWGVAHAADADEAQLVVLAKGYLDKTPDAGPEAILLKAQLAELETLRAAEATRRKKDAKAAVDAAVARGALPPKDEAVQAKWLGLIEADPKHAELLASLPDSPALKPVTTPGIVVQAKDGLLEALRGMSKVSLADTAQRAAIWAKDISPLFAKDYGFGAELSHVLAANSLATLSGELITQRTLSLLKLSFPWLPKISTDFSAEGGALNQVVKTRLKSVPGLAAYVPGTGYTRQNAVTTDVPVPINNHYGVEIAFNANELGSTNRDLFGEQVEGCHYALGKGLVDAVLAVITVANFANESVEAVDDVDADTMDVLDAALAARGVVGPRVGLFTSGVYRKLGKDSSIVSLAAFQLKEVITQAMLPPIKNIQPYEVFNMPAPVGENLIGFAGTSDALALATRVPNDYANALPGVSGNGTVQIVTNPDTGISVQLVRYVDHKAAEAAWRLALMWGAAKGNPAAGQRLISAARE